MWKQEGDVMLEKLKNWLLTFPDWGEVLLQVDTTDPRPDNAGLFPKGMEELERKTDIAGNIRVRCRSSFVLRRVVTQNYDRAARWMEALQNWVYRQSMSGNAPIFGDADQPQRLYAKGGKLENNAQTGTAVYTVTLIAEYTIQNTEE